MQNYESLSLQKIYLYWVINFCTDGTQVGVQMSIKFFDILKTIKLMVKHITYQTP